MAELSASGLGVAEFCRLHGVPASSLFAWRSRLRQMPLQATQPAASQPAATFVEARVPAGNDGGSDTGRSGSIEIVCGGGRRLIVRPGFDRQLLLDVIHALESLRWSRWRD